MSTKAKGKPGAGVYFLPLVIAAPIEAAMLFVLFRLWPSVHKLVSILIKMVVKA